MNEDFRGIIGWYGIPWLVIFSISMFSFVRGALNDDKETANKLIKSGVSMFFFSFFPIGNAILVYGYLLLATLDQIGRIPNGIYNLIKRK